MLTCHKWESCEESMSPEGWQLPQDCLNWGGKTHLMWQCLQVAVQMKGAGAGRLSCYSGLPCLQLRLIPSLIGEAESPEPTRFLTPDWECLRHPGSRPQQLAVLSFLGWDRCHYFSASWFSSGRVVVVIILSVLFLQRTLIHYIKMNKLESNKYGGIHL